MGVGVDGAIGFLIGAIVDGSSLVSRGVCEPEEDADTDADDASTNGFAYGCSLACVMFETPTAAAKAGIEREKGEAEEIEKGEKKSVEKLEPEMNSGTDGINEYSSILPSSFSLLFFNVNSLLLS